MRVLIYEGKEFRSISQLAAYTGIERSRLSRAIQKNTDTPIEDIIATLKVTKTYTYNGKEYDSIRSAADDLKLNKNTLSKYLKLANDNLEAAMELFHKEHTFATIDGVRYSSAEKLAHKLGVNNITLTKYINKSATIEEAVQAIISMKNKYVWRGKSYESDSSLARAMGMSRPTLLRLIEKNERMSLDDIYELYHSRNDGKFKGYTYGGKEYSSLRGMLTDLDISPQRYYGKIEECGGDMEKAIELLLEENEERKHKAEEKLKSELEQKALMEKKKIEAPVYTFNGEEYQSIAALSRAVGISETTIKRLLVEYGNDLDAAIKDRAENKIIYNYQGVEYPSIKALSAATGIKELRLGRYIRKYNRDAEKAIFMIKLRDSRLKANKEKDSDINIQDIAIILGIKRRDLETLLNSGMSIDEIKDSLSRGDLSVAERGIRAKKVMYDEKQSLHEYCVEHGLNYSCIYYAMTTYGKTKEQAIQNYKENGQKIPTAWIYERYGVLLKHLLLSENIDSKKIIAHMRVFGTSLEEAIENYIIDDISKERDLDKFWQREVYSALTLDIFSEDEKNDFIKEFRINSDEIQATEDCKARIDQVKRKMLLYEMSECIQEELFTKTEMATIMRMYNISADELETIFLELYSKFDNKVLLGSEQDELTRRRQIIQYIKELPSYSEENISDLRAKVSEDEYKHIIETSNLIQTYKEAVTTDADLLKLMRSTVRDNISTNVETRKELSKSIEPKDKIVKR
ncbi:MAG: hypothetical protein J6J36_04920 [Clostridia bacterium]|nr:hypothetical protein [Clostridia bacterium]